jgi:hypothetical protein
MISFKPWLQIYAFDVVARDKQGRFTVHYEVVAGDLQSAARFAVADIVKGGGEPLDIGDADAYPQKDLFPRLGVRLKSAPDYGG